MEWHLLKYYFFPLENKARPFRIKLHSVNCEQKINIYDRGESHPIH
jgi:hypothetical protein